MNNLISRYENGGFIRNCPLDVVIDRSLEIFGNRTDIETVLSIGCSMSIENSKFSYESVKNQILDDETFGREFSLKVPYYNEAIFLVNQSLRVWISYDPG